MSNWTYDPNGAIGRLGSATTSAGVTGYSGAAGYSRSHHYDALLRPIETDITVDGATYSTKESYDPVTGRPSTVTYPSGTVASYAYTSLGFVTAISKTAPVSGSSAAPYYAVGARDAGLRPLAVSLGTAAFTSTATTSASLSENYVYDALNRLSAVNGPVPKSFSIDSTGNLTNKSDVGTYTYGASGAGPHQVHSISGNFSSSYTYDPNGNMLTDTADQRTISWTSFNMPGTITTTNSGATVNFAYDPEHRRIVQNSSSAGATVYLWDDASGTYSQNLPGTREYLDYLYADGAMVGMQATTFNAGGAAVSSSALYYHTDGLGSVVALTNDAGQLVEQDGYDAWGKRRNNNGNDDPNDQISSETSRGFIQQEELASVGLVHLNARLYDPHIGRFISADPTGRKGGPNLYAYANNNPTTFTDPSGLLSSFGRAALVNGTSVSAQGEVAQPLRLDQQAVASLEADLFGNGFTGATLPGSGFPTLPDETTFTQLSAAFNQSLNAITAALDIGTSGGNNAISANQPNGGIGANASANSGANCAQTCSFQQVAQGQQGPPAQFVILSGQTQIMGPYSLFTYQLEDADGVIAHPAELDGIFPGFSVRRVPIFG